MKKILITIFLSFPMAMLVYSQQKSDPQEVKNHIGRNVQAGLDPYTGLNSVFTIKLKGLKEPVHVRQFDEGMTKTGNGKFLTCATDIHEGTTLITTEGNMEISDLKVFIYEQGKLVIPPNGVEIIEYRQDYYINID